MSDIGDWVLAFYVVASAVSLVVVLKGTWHRLRCPMCKSARAAVERAHPTWKPKLNWNSHRGLLDGRPVVAVFYEEPEMICMPTAYLLVRLERNGDITELNEDESKPYRIRNRK